MSQHIDPEVKQSFIVDNLTTNDAGKALSAKQGKALDDKITTLNGNNYPIGKGDTVSTSVNFNDYITPGIKTFTSNSAVTSSSNKPCNYGGRLVVWSASGGSLNSPWAAGGQIYIDFVGSQIMRSANANSSGTIDWSPWVQLASKSSVDALNGNLTTLQRRTAATTATGIETTGTDVSLPGNVGFVFFVMPRTAAISWHYILTYSKQNGNVNIKWITEEPSGVTIVTGVNKITVSHSQSNGLNAFTMMASW